MKLLCAAVFVALNNHGCIWKSVGVLSYVYKFKLCFIVKVSHYVSDFAGDKFDKDNLMILAKLFLDMFPYHNQSLNMSTTFWMTFSQCPRE